MVHCAETTYDAAYNDGYTLSGRIDLLLHDQEHDHYCLIDYKRSLPHNEGEGMLLSKYMQLFFYREILLFHNIEDIDMRYYVFSKNRLYPPSARIFTAHSAEVSKELHHHCHTLLQRLACADFSLSDHATSCVTFPYPQLCRSAAAKER